MDQSKRTFFGLFGNSTPGTPERSADEPFLPKGAVVIGNYTIQDRVGMGGLSEVYKATNYSGRDLALKIMRPEHVAQTDYTKLLEKEAELRKVQHPAIVEYHLPQQAVFDGQPFIFILMDFVDGPTLAKLMKQQGPIPASILLTLAERLASGLAAVHERRIFHRDLSPDNIILRGSDPAEAVIIDFGIARDEDADVSIIGDSFAGKRRYSPPEQFQNIITEQTDLYSLGMTLLAAARGNPQALDERGADMWPNLEGLQPRLAEVIRQLTGPKPSDRIQSARHLIDLLHSKEIMELPAPEPASFLSPSDDDDATVIGSSAGLGQDQQSEPPVSATPVASQTSTVIRPGENQAPKPFPVLPVLGGAVVVVAAAALSFIFFLLPQPSPDVTGPEVSEPATSPVTTPTTERPAIVSRPTDGLPDLFDDLADAPERCGDYVGGWLRRYKAQCFVGKVLTSYGGPTDQLTIYPYETAERFGIAPTKLDIVSPFVDDVGLYLDVGEEVQTGYVTVFTVYPWGGVQIFLPRTIPRRGENPDAAAEIRRSYLAGPNTGVGSPTQTLFDRASQETVELGDDWSRLQGTLEGFISGIRTVFPETIDDPSGPLTAYVLLTDQPLFDEPPVFYERADVFAARLEEGLAGVSRLNYAFDKFLVEPRNSNE
ncbi:MAG: serine/threonine-protein kinase [Pseudomonadota bacterium]